MKNLSITAMVLTVIGALNWGLVGLGSFLNTNMNLVNLLLGSWPAAEYLVYLLVGIAGIWVLWAMLARQVRM
jgi:uncharacterized membrane protein YuzA (DUF378 family)